MNKKITKFEKPLPHLAYKYQTSSSKAIKLRSSPKIIRKSMIF